MRWPRPENRPHDSLGLASDPSVPASPVREIKSSGCGLREPPVLVAAKLTVAYSGVSSTNARRSGLLRIRGVESTLLQSAPKVMVVVRRNFVRAQLAVA